MAVKIRLKRIGKKKMPYYRIVVADSRSPRDGRFIEEIGTYNPHTDPSSFRIDEEAARKWLGNGAQPTDVVARLFKVAGIKKDGKPQSAKDSKQASEQAEEPASEKDDEQVGAKEDGQEQQGQKDFEDGLAQ
jgi:small subunit ribosomal protein S16